MAFEYNDDGYEDEEELEEDIEDEENDEDDDEDEEAEYEAQLQEFARKKELENKLKKIERRLNLPFASYLTPTEQITVRRGKKEFPALVAKINAKLNTWKTVKASSAGGSLIVAKILFVVGCIVMAALLLALIVDSIASIFGGSGDDGKNGSEFGTPSEYIYGVRAIYEDEQQSREYLIDNYTNLISDTIDYVNNNNTTYIITLEIPDEVDYNNFITDDYTGNYTHIHYLTRQLTQAVYSADNTDGVASTFKDQLDGIKYFGVNEEILTPFATTLSTYIQTNYESLVKSKTDNNAVAPTGLENLVSSYFDLEEVSKARTEKYFIIDYTATPEGHAASLSTKRNYKAYIYLTQKNMKVNYLSYNISTKDAELSINYNNQALAVNNPEKVYEEADIWLYETSSENLNITVAPVNANYNQADEEKLTKSVSLLEIAGWDNNSIYLTFDETTNTYNYLTYGLFVEFNSTSPFTFSEFTTTVE